ncbi:MAG: hypothetical protein QOI48_4085 [Solirubrobacteraceae bacterium]|jgi:hypothetical protein|nr:hypothetical protein [Solirubrobacteraceae bacterium]
MFGSARSRREPPCGRRRGSGRRRLRRLSQLDGVGTRGRSALTETIILAKIRAPALSSSGGSWYWSKPDGSPRAWNGRPPTSYPALAAVYHCLVTLVRAPLEDAASDELLKAPGSRNLHNSSDPTGPLTYRS